MLTPEDIEGREFLVSLRGFDRAEVRAFMTEVAAVVRDLAYRLEEAQAQAEAAQAAAAAAAEVTEPAAVEAKGGSTPAGAPGGFAEIGRETQRIVDAAHEAAQAIARQARVDADRQLQSARRQAARLIAEGEQERDAAEAVVAGLEAARGDLTNQLRELGTMVERVIGELGSPPPPAATVREAFAAGLRPGPAPVRSARQERPATETDVPEPDVPELEPVVPEPEPVVPEPEPVVPEPVVPEPVVPEPVVPEPDVLKPDVPPPVAARPHDLEDQPEVEHVEEVESPVAGDVEPAADTEPSAAQPVEAADMPEEPPDLPKQEPPEEPAEEPLDSPEALVQEPPEETVESPEGPEALVQESPLAPAEEAAQEPDAVVEDPADPHGLRAAAITPLCPQLVRVIKRGMQDVQNLSLDRLRRSGDVAEPESLLARDEDLAAIGASAGGLLREAFLAGAAVASLLVDRDLPEPAGHRPLVDDFLVDAAQRIRAPLAATLRMARSTGETTTRFDRIGAVFAELRGTVAEELAVTHLMRAYELGLVDAWAAGGITQRRWVLGREPRCPEARCRQNSQAGVVAMGAAYPSGHEVPPIHIGCSCTTIPISEPAS